MISEQGILLMESKEFEQVYRQDLEEAISHGILVSNLAAMLSKELGLSKEACYDMAKAGMVHDIGKLKLGDYLYGRRKDTLKIEEMKYVRQHPKLGYEVLKDHALYTEDILQSVYHHHENFDGSGYPDNLRGNAIPYGARILRTCDVFGALVTERPYRAAFELDTAIELMIDEVKNFDMKIFLAFLKVVHSNEFERVKSFINDVNNKTDSKKAV